MKGKGIAGLILMAVVAVVVSFVARTGIGANGKLGINGINLGLDLSGGVSIVYQADKDDVSEDEMATTVAIIQNRLDRQGWTEGEASIQGENRVRVEIPGIENAEEAVKELGQTSQLAFVTQDGQVILTGNDVANATKSVGQIGNNPVTQSYVSLEFTEAGRQYFAQATSSNIGKPIYIVMNEEVISAPVVNTAITDGKAMITGDFTAEEAEDLAISIKEGSLPFTLTVVEMNNVGARLGADAIETSIFAALVGVCLVFVFMLLTYRLCGFAADWALIIYIGIEIIALSLFNVTLTLPGIAGIILSVGMAVDANVVIFERIKEEIVAGNPVEKALKAGFSRALPAIVDGNITTFIAGVVLYFMGTGTIKGFAQTLMIGIVISMFTAVVITRFILTSLIRVGFISPGLFGVKTAQIQIKEGQA